MPPTDGCQRSAPAAEFKTPRTNEEYVGAQLAGFRTRIESKYAASPLVSKIVHPVGWGLPALCGLFSDDQPRRSVSSVPKPLLGLRKATAATWRLIARSLCSLLAHCSAWPSAPRVAPQLRADHQTRSVPHAARHQASRVRVHDLELAAWSNGSIPPRTRCYSRTSTPNTDT